MSGQSATSRWQETTSEAPREPDEDAQWPTWKMILIVEAPGGIYKVWATIPAAINPERGDKLTLAITLKPKDLGFAIESRPHVKESERVLS